MQEIKKIVIQGAGALGALFATKFSDAGGFDVRLLASGGRYDRLKREGLIVNERHYALPVIHPDEAADPADLVLVASGTTTLEVAFHGRPMVVMYNASRLFYQLIGRWMIHTRHLSLPNILAGREIVPEFMP